MTECHEKNMIIAIPISGNIDYFFSSICDKK